MKSLRAEVWSCEGDGDARVLTGEEVAVGVGEVPTVRVRRV